MEHVISKKKKKKMGFLSFFQFMYKFLPIKNVLLATWVQSL